MFCSKCGTQVAEGSAFCHRCGSRLSQAGAEQSPPASPSTVESSSGDAPTAAVAPPPHEAPPAGAPSATAVRLRAIIDVPVHEQPDDMSREMFILRAGNAVEVSGEEGRYYKVRTIGGTAERFVRKEAFVPLGESDSSTSTLGAVERFARKVETWVSTEPTAQGHQPVHSSRFIYIGAALVALFSVTMMSWEQLGFFTQNGLHSLWGWVAFLAALALGGVATYDAVNRRNRRLNVWSIVTGGILVASFLLEIAYLATLCDENDLFCIRPGMGDGPFLALLDGICLIVLPFFIERNMLPSGSSAGPKAGGAVLSNFAHPADSARSQQPRSVSIRATGAAAYRQPQNGSSIVTKLAAGMTLEVIKETNGFYQVHISKADGDGYVRREDVVV